MRAMVDCRSFVFCLWFGVYGWLTPEENFFSRQAHKAHKEFTKKISALCVFVGNIFSPTKRTKHTKNSQKNLVHFVPLWEPNTPKQNTHTPSTSTLS
jgi:hypothetical protein